MEQADGWARLYAALPVLLAGGLWCAWWLWAVNWRKMGPTLAEGAWIPVVLLMLVAATVWSRIDPSECTCLGFVAVPSFWWQLGAVGLLAALALFCGWLQATFAWWPPEVAVEPPDHGGHDHAHDHDEPAHGPGHPAHGPEEGHTRSPAEHGHH